MTRIRLVACLFLLGILILPSPPGIHGQATTPPRSGMPPEQLRSIADNLYERGRFDDARQVYLQIQPQFAADAALNRNLGWSFYRGQRPNLLQAIRYWSLSWQIEENEPLQLEAARAYVRLGRWEEGTRLLLDLAERHFEHPEHWRVLAELAESAERHPQAITWYQTYLERRPGDIPARLNVGRLLGWADRLTEAITEYTIVLQNEPRNIAARVGTARILSWQGQYDDSLRMFDEVLREQPSNREAQMGKAYVLLWTNRYEEARPIFQALARSRPADPDVRRGLDEIARLEAAAAAPPPPPPLPPPAPVDPLESLRPRIADALARNDGPGAIALLQEGLRLAPGDMGLQRSLAQAYLMADRPAAAVTLLQQLRSANPDSADLLRELATAQFNADTVLAATETLREYTQRRPEDLAMRVSLGQWFSWARRYDEAVAVFQRVLEQEPENLDSLIGLARINNWQGRHADALGQFDVILSRHPGQRDALVGKSQALFWNGNTEEAFLLLAQIQQEFPQDREVASILESFRDAERQRVPVQAAIPPDVDTLIRSYQDVLSRSPQDFEALRMLGELYSRKDNYAEAATYYRRARERNPNDAQLTATLAQMLSWTEQFHESIQLYRELAQQDPANADHLLSLARVLSWAGNYNESVETYNRVLQLQPERVDARLGMAAVQSWNNNFDQSLRNYQLVFDQDPQNREAHLGYARVHAWKGDLDRAVRLYADLQSRFPNDRDILLGEGQALQWSGRAREAEQVLAPLRAAYPNDREVLLAMAGTQLALGRSDLALRDVRQAEGISPDHRDVRLMRSLVLREVRPMLVLGFSPSLDSDELHIFSYTSTLYFSPVPRIRSYVRASIIPSMIPSDGIVQGREAVLGATAQVVPWLILRGEAGSNFGSTGRTSTIGGGGFTLLPSPSWRFDFNASRRFVNFVPKSVLLDISQRQLQASLDYRPLNNLRLHFDYSHGQYSDGNRSHTGSVSLTQTLVRSEQLTLEGGYIYSVGSFASQPRTGYFAPSQLQRHGGLVNFYGQFNSRVGYNFSGRAGAEQTFDNPYRPQGTLEVSLDFKLSERIRWSVGYGYFRIAGLAGTGAYLTNSAFSRLEIQF